jgi:flagellar biosynthesis protein FlhF
MLRVREDLGPNAIILSIKKKPYRGMLGWFMKPKIIVQAAFEEKTSREKFFEEQRPIPAKSSLFARPKEPAADPSQIIRTARHPLFRNTPAQAARGEATDTTESFALQVLAAQNTPAVQLSTGRQGAAALAEQEPSSTTGNLVKQVRLNDQQQRIASLENKLSLTEELLSKVVAQLNTAERMVGDPNKRRFESELVQVFYESLLEQGVATEVAEGLLGDLDSVDEPDKIDITLIVKIVYNSIMEILSQPILIDTVLDPGKEPQVVVFMGPTGVGKTTTIAKLSSYLSLTCEMRVGLITADTYRIAAVEQLKTYADILGWDIRVVYGHEDMAGQCDELYAVNDIVLVDTAGRSHKNTENLHELQAVLEALPESKRYLVLSVTTRYEDLLKIINIYSGISDFDIIFTKLDEAESLGTILNICYLTGKKVSYVTFGQNVPDDMETVKPDKIAKSLLGLNNGHPYLSEGGL